MQWLIDLVLDKIRADGLATNRGNAATFDFELADLTADGATHLLDLSSILPANVTVAFMNIQMQSLAVPCYALFFTPGQADVWNRAQIQTTVANVVHHAGLNLWVDSDRVIAYRLSPANINWLRATIQGWDF